MSTASEMRVARRVADARGEIARARADGKRIGFVPTMGFLHDGHLALVDEARRRSDYVVLSIFVNPLQFGPGEDFGRYPRDEDGDLHKAREREVDLVFLPAPEEMYPGPARVVVSPRTGHERWEGPARPGHFEGMLTVVAKLFHIVAPDVAVFGRKDLQQASLVRAMTSDLDLPIEIVVAPTIREPDGLAMSSRNAYLSVTERRRALGLSRALQAIRDAYEAGERDAGRLRQAGEAALAAAGEVELEYLALVGPDLEPVVAAQPGTAAIIAATVGRTRLIDNLVLGDR